MTVEIRNAAAKDASGIARVHIDSWRDTYAGMLPIQMFRRMGHRQVSAQWSRTLKYARRSELVLVAEDPDAGIVGFASCASAKGLDLPYRGEVTMLYVHPDFQAQAIGRALLARSFGVLAGKGLGSALIWVLADNPARFFYQAMGGKMIAERRERLWGVPLQELAYGWDDLKTAIPRVARGAIAKRHSG